MPVLRAARLLEGFCLRGTTNVLKFLPGPVKGSLASLMFAVNTVFWCLLIYPFAALKMILPFAGARRLCTAAMVALAENWISVNSFEIALFHELRFHVQGVGGLDKNKSYLVIANHQSWVDIVILQQIFNRRIPFLRFFLKKELLYVPFLGLAWWALDFPFMKRHSKAYLEKYPEKRGEDLITTQRACEKFQGSHISVLNFIEGTRFTQTKHSKQNSPYLHLLSPKTGGVAFVIEAMGAQFDAILDVTIVYPKGAVSLWQLFSGQLDDVYVEVQKIPLPASLAKGGYLANDDIRRSFQSWVREIWVNKDKLIDRLKKAAPQA
jgi:1-acyl-sn-glycerol-3-phosphate acyltransferase